MSKYPLTREYLALRRYMYRHYFSDSDPVNSDWFHEESRAIALLLAQDDRPSEDEFNSLADEYGIFTYFPFMKDATRE